MEERNALYRFRGKQSRTAPGSCVLSLFFALSDVTDVFFCDLSFFVSLCSSAKKKIQDAQPAIPPLPRSERTVLRRFGTFRASALLVREEKSINPTLAAQIKKLRETTHRNNNYARARTYTHTHKKKNVVVERGAKQQRSSPTAAAGV